MDLWSDVLLFYIIIFINIIIYLFITMKRVW